MTATTATTPLATTLQRWFVRAWSGITLLVCAVAGAQTPPPPGPANDTPQGWSQMAQQWVQHQIQEPASAGPATLRPELVVGQLDPRLRLAPCNRVEPFLPEGTRLWGRTRVGLRCADGPTHWTVFLPITVKAWGPAWVIRQPVAPGTTLTTADAEATEVDWAEGVSPILARQQDWVGAQATRALMPGQTLRQGMVRPPQAFSAGSQVKVVVDGQGFSLSATGEAMSNGFVGLPARVRMANGQIITGTVRDSDTVEAPR